MKIESVPAIILSSISLYAGIYHLLIYVRRPRPRENLTFALFCFAVCLYDVLCAGLYSSLDAGDGVRWQHLQSAALSGVGIALLWFVVDYTGQRGRRAAYLLTAAFVAVLLAGRFGTDGLLWTDRPSVKEIRLPLGLSTRYAEMEAGLLVVVQSAVMLVLFLYAFWAAGRRRSEEEEKRAALPLLLATGMFFLAVVNDFSVSTGLYAFLYVKEYAFLGFVVLMTLSMTNDVLRSAEIEKALEVNEERLKLALDGANAGLWDYREDADRMYYSPGWFQMLGYEPKDFPHTTETFFSLLHPDDLRGVRKHIDAIRTSGRAFYSHEFRMRTRDGDWRWINSRGKVVRRTTEGKIGRIIGIHLDITARRAVESALRESEERFRALVRFAPLGVLMYELADDDRLILLDANPMASRLLGVDLSELFGKTIEEAFPALADTEVPARFRLAARHGLPWETRNFSYQDELIAGAFDVYAFQVSPGTMAVMFLEVTDRIRAEEQLRQSQKMQAVGRLAGGVAHDFNNLLQAIRGYTEFSIARLDAGTAVHGHLSEVARASERAASLTDQLLAFSRSKPLEPRQLDVGEVISDLMKMLRRLIGEQVQFSVRAEEGLPRVFADRGQLEQVLMNLCLNARDAMPRGGEIRIRTGFSRFDAEFCAANRWATEGDFVVLEVVDNGEGIPEDIQHRIYEPFYTTKEVGKGVGLGLSTVYAIVERHGGLIHMVSEAGRGTTFTICMPAMRGHADGDSDEDERKVVRGGDETILLAEDNELVREFARTVLEEAGYRVREAVDGEEALRIYEANVEEIDLALLDVIMPRMGGREVFSAIRSRRPRLPILFSTGYGFRSGEEGRLPEGERNLLKKPYTPDVLLARIREALDGPIEQGEDA